MRQFILKLLSGSGLVSRLVLALIALALIASQMLTAMGRLLILQSGRLKIPRRPSEKVPRDVLALEQLLEKKKSLTQRQRRHLERLFFFFANHFQASGRLRVAIECIQFALKMTPSGGWGRLKYGRVLGALLFMSGRFEESRHAFRAAGMARKMILGSSAFDPGIRVLGDGWFVAIGHIATLDFYIKKRLLGWSPGFTESVAAQHVDSSSGKVLAYQFQKYGIKFIYPQSLDGYYSRAAANASTNRSQGRRWSVLSENVRSALVDEFWDYDFPDGEVLPYTHGAAKVQQKWEEEQRPPLLSLDESQRQILERLLVQIGIPREAWYVCLHVREPGFHAKWNTLYPAARDANIGDYKLVIESIVARGGWVIRMGDPSMKPLAPMAHVVDYAHSDFKTEIGDIVIAASCRFFLGTNSGFATVPGIYGVPCVLTNWVPIALPLWFGQDLMISKMFWHKGRNQYAKFEEIFGTQLGATQNVADFPSDIEIRDNTPEEINEVALEMFDRVEGNAAYSAADEELQDKYFALALKHGSYKGSRIGREFLTKHEALLV